MGDRPRAIHSDSAGELTTPDTPAEVEPLRNQNDYRITDAVADPPGESSPLVTGKIGDYRGPNLSQSPLARTRSWQDADPDKKGLQLRCYEKGGRVVAMYAPYGIHDTLDGHTACKAMSYLPSSAMDIAANVVLYAAVMGGKPAPSPASSPSPGQWPAAQPRHSRPHSPQLEGSAATSVQPAPGQSRRPPGHTHWPAPQLAPGEQATSQRPQCVGSLCRSAQEPLQFS